MFWKDFSRLHVRNNQQRRGYCLMITLNLDCHHLDSIREACQTNWSNVQGVRHRGWRGDCSSLKIEVTRGDEAFNEEERGD